MYLFIYVFALVYEVSQMISQKSSLNSYVIGIYACIKIKYTVRQKCASVFAISRYIDYNEDNAAEDDKNNDND